MQNVKEIVLGLVDRYGTTNPYEIADRLGILVQGGPLGQISGCHLKIAGRKFIYVNSDEPRNIQQIVAAHELGHAILHEEEYYFFTWGDGFYRNRAEIEAHTFAAELLVPDCVIIENPGYTTLQLAKLTGYTERLLSFKKI